MPAHKKSENHPNFLLISKKEALTAPFSKLYFIKGIQVL